MTGDTHYDLEVLAELAEGLLDEATADQVREHLAVCDSCGENLADLAAVRELLASVPVPAMPLGVAKRIDQALAAEAERLTLGAPWEEITPEPVPADDRPAPAPAEAPADAPAEPVRLGVVAEDGTVVPVQPKKRARSSARRRFSARRWALTAAAAAAVVMGVTGVTAGLLAAEGGGSPEQTYVASEPTGTATAGQPSYTVYASGHNYTSEELRGPLLGYFGVAPGSGTADDESLDTCVRRYAELLDRPPIGVDKAFYNGNEATIMAFWEDASLNAVRVVVVDANCKSLRPQSLASWK